MNESQFVLFLDTMNRLIDTIKDGSSVVGGAGAKSDEAESSMKKQSNLTGSGSSSSSSITKSDGFLEGLGGRLGKATPRGIGDLVGQGAEALIDVSIAPFLDKANESYGPYKNTRNILSEMGRSGAVATPDQIRQIHEREAALATNTLKNLKSYGQEYAPYGTNNIQKGAYNVMEKIATALFLNSKKQGAINANQRVNGG